MLRLNNSQTKAQDIIKHFVNNGFFHFTPKLTKFIYGPFGERLLENIRNEWLYSNVTNREHNVYPFYKNTSSNFQSDIKEGYVAAKTLNNNELPFGLANSRSSVTIKETEQNLFPSNYTLLRYIGFYKPKDGKQCFYRWIQQRKRWWRKLSADPGRFTFSELEKDENSLREHVKILANFPWGTHNVETVEFLGSDPFHERNFNLFSVYDGTENCFPHVVESRVNLDYATYTYMCDSYNLDNESKVICRFHRKLAPYKFAFAAPELTNNKLINELFDMSHMIGLELRKVGLSNLLPVKTEFGKKNLNHQLERFNSLGIPYTVVLNEHTFNTGIFGLYSRETTLQEEVHLSTFQDYGVLLMKNY